MRIDCERLVNGGRLDWTGDDGDRRTSDSVLRVLVG
jgi:hypothetical protein